jgi:hypothetical protein
MVERPQAARSDLRLVTKKFPVREYMRSPYSLRNSQKTRQNKSTYRKIDNALLREQRTAARRTAAAFAA